MAAQLHSAQRHQQGSLWGQDVEQSAEKVLANYTDAYRKLYNRVPKQLELIDHEWVLVNGARMRVSELAYLTTQLLQEYQQSTADKRGVVMRLLKWFKGN